MPFKIMSYDTVNQLADLSSKFQHYRDTLHITATNSLRRGIFINNTDGIRWIDAPVLTFGQILNGVGNQWYTSKTQLKQYTLISKALREYTERNNNYDLSIFNALDKNKDVVLRTIRMLEEATLTEQSVNSVLNPNISTEEEMCLYVWKELAKDNSIINFRNWFKRFNNNKYTRTMFETIITNALIDAYKSDNERQMSNLRPIRDINENEKEQFQEYMTTQANVLLKSKQIVLHGFYFITPIQQRIIHALHNAGYTIIHLINYREGFPSVFETVEKFLDIKGNNYDAVSQSPNAINIVSNKFLHSCEGDFSIDLSNGSSKYFEFIHMYQFKKFIESEQNENDFLISPRAREVRRHLEDISNLTNLKLKDYPIGQFLIDVHSLNTTNFSEDTQQFKDREELGINIILRIFASDYLIIDGNSSREYVSDLQKITERLSDKSTFDEWIDELKQLIEDKQNIEYALTSPNLKDSTIDTDLYVYSHRLLSYFAVPVTRLQAILKGLEKLKELYLIIFTGDNINLNTYLETLHSYVKSNILPSITIDEEKDVAHQLLNTLENLKDDDIESFDRRDLIQGLRFFLSEDIENETTNSLFGESFLDSRIVSLQDGDILPFVDDEHVHLAFLDNKSLPLSQNLVTWPFNDDSMDLLYKNSTYLNLIKKRKDLDASITKYLIYLITENAASIKFSIVSNFNAEKGLKPSFYVDLLELPKGNITVTNPAKDGIAYQYETIPLKTRLVTSLLTKTKERCSKRFAFSYLLQDFSTFESDFHQRFIFESLLSRYRKIQGNNKDLITAEEMKDFIYSWFPHWSNTKKDVLNKKSKEWKYRESLYTYNKSITFYDDLTRVALFGSKSTVNNSFANPGPSCKYCPFQMDCRESVKIADE